MNQPAFRILILCLLLSAIALAQGAAHTVLISWTDTINPTNTTYNVYRSPGLCSGSPVFAKIGSAITVKSFTDAAPPIGNSCYTVTATFNGAEGSQAVPVPASVPPATVTSLQIQVN